MYFSDQSQILYSFHSWNEKHMTVHLHHGLHMH